MSQQPTCALIAAIEGDQHNTNMKTNVVMKPRLFEAEAIRCFSAWRQRGGWLKDIPIYAMCPTTNGISEDTKQKFTDLNVHYIEEYCPETETFTNGFLNSPFVGKVMESRLQEDVLIKIDLDMALIKPLPRSFVFDHDIVCGQYDNYCTDYQRSLPAGWDNPLDTSLMITKRASGFYQFFMSAVDDLLTNRDDTWETIKAVTGEYFLEEYLMDKIFYSGEWSITPIQRYQLGEWYTPVKMLTDVELNDVYFWHEHIKSDSASDVIRQRIEYFNRTKRMPV